jgi:hypothetical protein
MVAQLEHLREAYPPQVLHALMNLLSSHDQARALHHFGWHDGVTDAATIAQAKAAPEAGRAVPDDLPRGTHGLLRRRSGCDRR